MVEVFTDSFQHESLFALAKLLMARLIRHGKIGIRVQEPAICVPLRAVDADIRGFRMRIHIVRLSDGLVHDDGNTAVRRNHILHKEGGFRHHRPPPSLIPANRAVIEQNLEMAVIIHIRLDLVGEPQAHAAHFYRPGVGDLAHDVHVMHTAIDDQRRRVHQVLVRFPGCTARLLVQVHAEDIRPAKLARLFYQPHP
ncbi:Uncharacterised protein [Brucella melitensis]|nr:Uncharacterised protein [Brucella melitensis]